MKTAKQAEKELLKLNLGHELSVVKVNATTSRIKGTATAQEWKCITYNANPKKPAKIWAQARTLLELVNIMNEKYLTDTATKVFIFTGGAHFTDALQQCKTVEQLNHYWSTVPDDVKNFKCCGDEPVNVVAFEKRISEVACIDFSYQVEFSINGDRDNVESFLHDNFTGDFYHHDWNGHNFSAWILLIDENGLRVRINYGTGGYYLDCAAIALKELIAKETALNNTSQLSNEGSMENEMTTLIQKYYDLKNVMENKTSETLAAHGVFFAFSNKQFNENKTAIEDDDRYTSIGGGGYMPASKADSFFSAMESNTIWFDSQIKEQGLEETEIEHELGNHECYYTGSIGGAMDALGDKYTRDQVLAVYRKNRDSHNDECGTPIN